MARLRAWLDWRWGGCGLASPSRLLVCLVFSGRLVFARLRVMVALLRYLRGNVSFVDRKEESV